MARYIDAEKLLNELQKRYASALSWYENVRDPELKIRAEQAVASFLESILTIKKQPIASCCPECGAKMDEGGEDNETRTDL